MFEHRGMAAVVPAPAQRARPETVGRSEGDRPLPVLPALEPLFATGGLRRGSAVTVRGSASLLLALLAGPSRRGAWCGVVGLPGLGLVAAAEAGIALERLALVPDPGRDWAAVAAALLDAMEVVVVAPAGRVLDGDVRRLVARARQRGAVLVPFGAMAWPGAELRLSLAGGTWEGLGDGSGHLRARRVLVPRRGPRVGGPGAGAGALVAGPGRGGPPGRAGAPAARGAHPVARTDGGVAAPRSPILHAVPDLPIPPTPPADPRTPAVPIPPPGPLAPLGPLGPLPPPGPLPPAGPLHRPDRSRRPSGWQPSGWRPGRFRWSAFLSSSLHRSPRSGRT